MISQILMIIIFSNVNTTTFFTKYRPTHEFSNLWPSHSSSPVGFPKWYVIASAFPGWVTQVKVFYWRLLGELLKGNNFAKEFFFAYLSSMQHTSIRENKSGVINDPLGQPTVPAGSDCRLILKFRDGRTDTLCENSDHYRPGLWSASWIKNSRLGRWEQADFYYPTKNLQC